MGCSCFTPEVTVPPDALPAVFQVVLIIYKLTYIVLSRLSGPGLVESLVGNAGEVDDVVSVLKDLKREDGKLKK